VPVLADFTWLCRKIVGKTAEPRPSPCAALATDPELEAHLFDQLQNAAAAVHDTVCEERIIAYEAAVAGVLRLYSFRASLCLLDTCSGTAACATDSCTAPRCVLRCFHTFPVVLCALDENKVRMS
jgi:hypothetical protein